jgi:hypothetical protein
LREIANTGKGGQIKLHRVHELITSALFDLISRLLALDHITAGCKQMELDALFTAPFIITIPGTYQE